MNLSTKQNNRKLVLDYIQDKSEVVIADIASETGISKPTIQKVLRFYEDQGLVVTAGKGESTEEGGKKPLLYQFNKDFGSILTVHIGPSFIFGAIADMNADLRHTLFLERKHEDQEKLFQTVIDLLKDFLSHEFVLRCPPVSIVIAIPGIVDSEKGIAVYSPHYTNWEHNFPLRDHIQKSLSTDIPIYIDCVNRYQAIAEHWKGKARDVVNFVMIDAMLVGVGAGIYVNNEIRSGYQNLAGEVGHMILQPIDGPTCICGGSGCFESLVSINYIRKLMCSEKELVKRIDNLSSLSNEALFQLLLAEVEKSDPLCLKILDSLAFWFALGINNIIMINDPELIILEGIYKDMGPLFLTMIKKNMSTLSMQEVDRTTQIEFSSFGPERGVIGASIFALHSFIDKMFT